MNNVQSILSKIVGKYKESELNNSLPDKTVLIADAYSKADEQALAEKAENTFSSQNSSIKSASRLKSRIRERIYNLAEPHIKKLWNKLLGTDEYHVRLLPRDKQKRTIFNMVTFAVVSIVALATPLIAWFAMSRYLIASQMFIEFYEDGGWWKAMLFTVLGVTSTFLLKQYEDRLLKTDEDKRRFAKKVTWISITTIGLWITLYATLFSFSDSALLEGTEYEVWAVWGFTMLQLFSEIVAGAVIWSYASYLNNANKEYETSDSEVFKTVEEKEAFYSADLFTLESYSEVLDGYIERFENTKKIYVANYVNQIALIRGRIAMKQTQATFQYIDNEIGDRSTLKIHSL